MPSNRTIIVTGGAGFIGSHVCEALAARGDRVIAIDNLDPFYPPAIKRENLQRLTDASRFRLIEADVRDPDLIRRELEGEMPTAMIHLASLAGVRPSLARPAEYIDVNVGGTVAMLELARELGIRQFVLGSSSSVYGDTARVPFTETDGADRPISPYAASKRAAELVCHTYHHLYDLSVVCLRFFTVYGPRQRPDLAIHKFARLMLAGAPIPFYGDGSTERDYTYVDDIVAGVVATVDYLAHHESVWEIINLGENTTTSLSRLVELIAAELGVEPRLDRLPMQPGDVQRTFADVSRARDLLGYSPSTSMEAGIAEFVRWLRSPDG